MGVQNFINAGQAAANNAVKNITALRRNAPKYEEISKESIEARADMKSAAMLANAKVAKAGIQEYARNQQVANNERAKEKIRGIKKNARMAGGLAQLAATGAMLPSMMKKQEADNSISSLMAKRLEALRAKKGQPDTKVDTGPDAVTQDLQSQITELEGKIGSGGSSGSSSSTDTSTGSSGSSKPMKSSGNLKMDYMTKLTNAGMSDVQAAATVGHMMVETGGFKHMEELSPNAYGTKGYGHLQWTDTGSGGGRRTDFMNWSKKNGLDPQSFEANSGFLVHEMTTNFNGSWTGGGSFEGLKGLNTLEEASGYLQSNFIRPHKDYAHTDRRLSEGHTALKEWRALQGQS